ncbi:MAG: DUF3107 domain-containing protein [Propionibacteriaceae bacterium]|nr:DUF3107 domain-containing protein [Propionibacteriaceae bacterium]
MEVKVGIQHVNRELTLETKQSAAQVEEGLVKALSDQSVFALSDENGRRVVIPADKIAYVDLGQEKARRVGFGQV